MEYDPNVLSMIKSVEDAQTPEAAAGRQELLDFQLAAMADPNALNFAFGPPGANPSQGKTAGPEAVFTPEVKEQLIEESGLTVKDFTDLVFDYTNPVDYGILAMAIVFPPGAIAAKLAQKGLQGKKLYRLANQVYELQQRMPRWAAGGPPGSWTRPRVPLRNRLNPNLPPGPGSIPVNKPGRAELATRTYLQGKLLKETGSGIGSLWDTLRAPGEEFREYLPEEVFEE